MYEERRESLEDLDIAEVAFRPAAIDTGFSPES